MNRPALHADARTWWTWATKSIDADLETCRTGLTTITRDRAASTLDTMQADGVIDIIDAELTDRHDRIAA